MTLGSALGVLGGVDQVDIADETVCPFCAAGCLR